MTVKSYRTHAVLKIILLIIGIVCIAAVPFVSHAQSLSPLTTIPVRFVHTVKSNRVHAGEPVLASTIQTVQLPDGQSIPKGSVLQGHIVEARPFVFDTTPYAIQQPSYLSIHFDKIILRNTSVPAQLYVRALVDNLDADKASSPIYLDETDRVGTRQLVGQDQFSPLAKEVLNSDGDVVGYNRKDGVHARLIANRYIVLHEFHDCPGTNTEQAVGIFSADACGIYGFVDVDLSNNGSDNNGTFKLESHHHSVTLQAGSAALLQAF
jgi:hypothetical protein